MCMTILFLFLRFLLYSLVESIRVSGCNILLLGPDHQVPLHGIGILAICIILGLYFTDLELQSLGVKIQGGPITLPHVQGHVLSIECLHHCLGCLVHQLLGQT